MRRGSLRALLWVGVLLALWPWSPPRTGAGTPLALRLVGPFASLAASVEWVRFDLAVREGRYERAYGRAERALRLDPRAPQGWVTLSSHLCTFRASLQNEPDPAARRAWIRAGLELLERGEGLTSDPAELAFARGITLVHVALIDGDEGLGWPGGWRAARDAAARAFRRAEELGHPQAGALAERVLEPEF